MSIVAARKGDEEIEARALSRRGFLRLAAGGAAAAVVPAKTYFFFGGICRPAPPVWVPPENLTNMLLIGAVYMGIAILGGPGVLAKMAGPCPKA